MLPGVCTRKCFPALLQYRREDYIGFWPTKKTSNLWKYAAIGSVYKVVRISSQPSLRLILLCCCFRNYTYVASPHAGNFSHWSVYNYRWSVVIPRTLENLQQCGSLTAWPRRCRLGWLPDCLSPSPYSGMQQTDNVLYVGTVENHGNHGNRVFPQRPWFCQNAVFCRVFCRNAVVLRFF